MQFVRLTNGLGGNSKDGDFSIKKFFSFKLFLRWWFLFPKLVQYVTKRKVDLRYELAIIFQMMVFRYFSIKQLDVNIYFEAQEFS